MNHHETVWFKEPLGNFAQAVKENSGGSVRIELYPANALVPNQELTQAVKEGEVDMGLIHGETIAGGLSSPLMHAGSLPFLYNDNDGLTAAVQAGIGDLLSEELAAHNITTIKWQTMGIAQLLHKYKMLDQPMDVADEKIRCVHGMQEQAITHWGGTPIFMPVGELYEALQNDVIHGAALSLYAYYSFQLYDVAPYFCVDYAFANLAGLCINSDAWNSLKQRQRSIITDAATNCASEMLAKVKQLDEEARIELEALGINVYDLTPVERADWRVESQPVWEQ